MSSNSASVNLIDSYPPPSHISLSILPLLSSPSPSHSHSPSSLLLLIGFFFFPSSAFLDSDSQSPRALYIHHLILYIYIYIAEKTYHHLILIDHKFLSSLFPPFQDLSFFSNRLFSSLDIRHPYIPCLFSDQDFNHNPDPPPSSLCRSHSITYFFYYSHSSTQ